MCSLVPIPFSFTGSWWSPQASPFSKGKEGMHLAGEMDVSTCWNFTIRAVLLGISLTQNSPDSDLQQMPFFPGTRALCAPSHGWHCPPLTAASFPAATGREGGRVHHQKPLCASSLSQGNTQSTVSLMSPLLQQCYQVIPPNWLCCIFLQCRINTILGCILSF